MNQTTTIYDAAKETLEIFRHFDTAFVSQVPSEFLAELEQFASQSTKAFQVDLQKRLMEQELSEEAKDLLSFLYYSYGASEAEKREIQKVWNENEREYQKKIAEETELASIWEKKKDKKEVESKILPVVIETQSIWQKIRDLWNKLWEK